MFSVLLLGFLLFAQDEVEEVQVARVQIAKERVEVAEALPGFPKEQVVQKLRVAKIEIDAKGMVQAVSGKAKLAAFDVSGKEKMKKLDQWLAKIVAKGKIRVNLKVHEDTTMQSVTDLLDVLATQGVTEITFSDFLKKE